MVSLCGFSLRGIGCGVLGSLGGNVGGGVGGAGTGAMAKAALGAVGRSLVADMGSLDMDGVAGAGGADE